MKRLVFAALLAGACALTACGGDDDDDGDLSVPDAGDTPDANIGLCDPVAQTGCPSGQKCSTLQVSDVLNMTACVPNGSVALGQACTPGAPGEQTGYDNCASSPGAPAECVNDLCRQICTTTPDSCPDDSSCSLFDDLFDDVTSATLGVCAEVCDPILQDCALEGEGCYLNIFDLESEATCVGIVEQSVGLTQGDPCHGPPNDPDEGCFLNGCDKGYHPTVIDIPPEGGRSVCTAYCRAESTYVDDPEGDYDGTPATGATVGNPEGLEDGNCNIARIEVGGHHCRLFEPVIGPNNEPLRYIQDDYGFCLDVTGANLDAYGDCSVTSYERQFKAYDDGFPPPEGGEPEIGDAGRENYCLTFPARCGGLCTTEAKFEEIANAYCTANKKSPICQPPALTRGRNDKMLKVYLGRGTGSIRSAIAQ